MRCRLSGERHGEAYAALQEGTVKVRRKAPGSCSVASWEQEGFGQSGPEPFFGAEVGVVTNRDEPQDAGKLLLHRFAFDRNEAFGAGS